MCNPKDIYHFLTETSSQYGDKPLFTYLRDKKLHDITYSTFFYHVRQVAQRLSSILLDEKRIAIIAENSYEWLTYYWGTMLLGKAAVLIDPEMHYEEITKRLQLCNVRFVCVGEDDRTFGDTERILMEFPDGPALDLEGHDSTNREKSEAAVLFSTGTTGDFKTIHLAQRSIVCGLVPYAVEYVNTIFLPLPFYHVMTQICVITAMTYGRKVYIGSGIKYVLKDLQAFEPEMMCVTPMYLNLFVQRLERRANDPDNVSRLFGRNLQGILTGGASPQKKVLDALCARGIRMFSIYGSSETSTIASGEISGNEKCVGYPVPYMQMKFENGEIVVKGPSMFLGYSEKEDVTDEWYYTGDLGYLDDSGRLFLTGRKKNLIILSNGKNVSPEHLEAELFTISQVEQAMVYGEDDKICAEIYTEDSGEDIRQKIKDRIMQMNIAKPTYYQIQKVIFRDMPFPHVGIGKIRRNNR